MISNIEFYDSLKPLLIVSKIVGLYPNEIKSSGSPCNICQIINILWSLSVLLFFTLYSFHSTFLFHFADDNNSTIGQKIGPFADFLQLSLSFLNAGVIATNSIVMRKQVDNFLEKISSFDIAMSMVDPSIKVLRFKAYANRRRYILALLVSVFLFLYFPHKLLSWILFINDYSFLGIGAHFVAYTYPLIVITILEFHFVTGIVMLWRRFIWINVALKKARHRCDNRNNSALKWKNNLICVNFVNKKDSSYSQMDKTISVLDKLRLKHLELCELCQEFNGIYHASIVVTILYFFVALTLTIFLFIFNSNLAQMEYPIWYSIYCILTGCIYCGQLLIMTVLPPRAIKQARLTEDILHSFKTRKENLDCFIMHFSLQILHTVPDFTGCRIFVLDGTLLFSIVGAISTYLVIVVQLQSLK